MLSQLEAASSVLPCKETPARCPPLRLGHYMLGQRTRVSMLGRTEDAASNLVKIIT